MSYKDSPQYKTLKKGQEVEEQLIRYQAEREIKSLLEKMKK